MAKELRVSRVMRERRKEIGKKDTKVMRREREGDKGNKLIICVLSVLILAVSLLNAGIANAQTFQWPLSPFTTTPRITQDYACRGKTDLIDGVGGCYLDEKYHTGIDMNSARGTNEPVYPADGGTVCLIQANDGNDHRLGNTIIISHGSNVYSLYAHLKDPPTVSVSDRVEKVDKIGITGGTGDGSDTYYPIHLHFEVKKSCELGDKDDLNWGYTPGSPSVYGYYDPWEYISTMYISPVPVKVVNAEVLNVRRGPGTDYSVFTKVSYDQEFVAFAKSVSGGDVWYRIYLPCDNITCAGWIAGTVGGPTYSVEEPTATQIEVQNTGVAGLNVRSSPGGPTATVIDKIWDGQRFVTFENSNNWYRFYLPISAGASDGWSYDDPVYDYLNVIGGSSVGSFYLSFPLSNYTPYNAPISSVFDHSMSTPYCPDNSVVAYTGEKGTVLDPNEDPFNTSCGILYSFKNTNGNPFNINGNYDGTIATGPSTLNYDGHPGYDYRVDIGTDVLAAADGVVIDVDTVGNTSAGQYIKIAHSQGYQTLYMHLNDIYVNTTNNKDVTRGQVIGKSGDTGGVSPHLHFEVRRNGKIVDPYGWEWITGDPIDPQISGNNLTEVQIEPLWGIPQPEVTNVTLVPSSGGFTATINGQNFKSGALVTLWDRYGQFFSQNITPDSVSDTQIIADLPISNPENYVLKIKNPSGPRSKGVALSSSTSSSFVPLVIIGAPAPGGGTFSSFASFYDMNNSGDVVFTAEVDTNGDGIGDEAGTFKFANGQISKIEVSGITKVGAVKINDVGDMAFGDASIPGRTQAIYFLKAGTSTPIKIAEWDQLSPISGTTYDDLRGPLAIGNNGEVTFSSRIFDASINTILCCYLFLYSSSDGSVIKVVGGGDGAPIGGTFNIADAPPTQISSDGDVIFESSVDGVSTYSGIFLFSSGTLEFTKVVVHGDTAPPSIGGTLQYPSFRQNSVSGRRLVFQANVSGGISRQAIFVKDDVRLGTTTDVRVAAYEAQSTGTEVGGRFAHQDYPGGSLPFSPYGDAPQTRADGGVVFFSRLQDAFTVEGLPTQEGIFLWTGREFKKIAVEGDRLPSGGILGGVSRYIINDIGQVVYFVARID